MCMLPPQTEVRELMERLQIEKEAWKETILRKQVSNRKPDGICFVYFIVLTLVWGVVIGYSKVARWLSHVKGCESV